ncbi:hypothetical protein NC652_039268 [Populus alba x Populus x berolinensis]|nr:hypothetical protein NC652_039268 [Populus alba x Populus x berolinensis]
MDTTREQTLPVATVQPVLFLCQADQQLSAQHVSSEPLCTSVSASSSSTPAIVQQRSIVSLRQQSSNCRVLSIHQHFIASLVPAEHSTSSTSSTSLGSTSSSPATVQ